MSDHLPSRWVADGSRLRFATCSMSSLLARRHRLFPFRCLLSHESHYGRPGRPHQQSQKGGLSDEPQTRVVEREREHMLPVAPTSTGHARLTLLHDACSRNPNAGDLIPCICVDIGRTAMWASIMHPISLVDRRTDVTGDLQRYLDVSIGLIALR